MNADKYHAVPIIFPRKGNGIAEIFSSILMLLKTSQPSKQAIPIEISANYGKKEIFTRESGLFKKPWSERIDVILPVVHGTSVEDGCLQGLLETAGIPYAGPGVLGSAVGMDKIMMR